MNKQLNLFSEEQLKGMERPVKELNADNRLRLAVPEQTTFCIDLNEWELVSEEVTERNILEIKLKKKAT